MALSKVSEDENLYISGIFSLSRKEAMREANITHVLSVLQISLDTDMFEPYQHMRIDVNDVESENLLEHFPAANAFIRKGLDGGGGVLVHCAMGKSRSATCVIAYLMQKHHVSPQEALAQIRRYRPMCEPNEGFMQQLEVYHEMSCDDELDENPIYQRWLYQQDVELSRACGRPPDQVRFEDEHGGIQPGDDDQNADFRLSCRKCRRTLATSQYLIQHEPGKGGKNLKRGRPAPESSGSACAHYFLDPLSWMRPELEQGKMEGRFECPKCRANVGKYAWQGMACSCGHWIIPGISLARGRVDEVKSRTAPSGHDAFVTRPPGVGDGSSGAGGLPAGRGGQKGSL